MTTNGNSVEFSQEDMLRLRGNIADLSVAVEQKLPQVRNILSVIHTVLRADPDVITMLEPEEVAVIVSGMGQDKGLAIQAAEKKTASAAKRSASKMTLNDL